jgi:hypothetical protein
MLVLTLLASACTTQEEPETPAATLRPSAEEPTAQEPPESEPASASPSPSVAALPAAFEVDSDGNTIPDVVEQAGGYDPLVDDCVARSCPGVAGLDPGVTSIEQNVLLVLDSSGSMAADDGAGTVKIDAARAALERYAYGVPPNYRLGLEVFGHRGSNDESGKAESCAGIDIVAPLGNLTADTAADALNQFQPTGYTPIAAALQRAPEAFAGTEGAGNRVILVTDGIETCDGDPVAAAAALKQAGIAVTVDVIGFDVEGEADQAALRAIAEATGGTYTNARDAAELNAYFDDLLGRLAATMDQYVCVAGALGDVRTCVHNQVAAAQDELLRLGAEAPDRATADLYYALYDEQIKPWGDAEAARLEAFRNDTLQQLAAQYEQIRQRYQERYGRPLALGPLCMDRYA